VPAPIALFVYNRLQHTRLTVEALQQNELVDKSDLFVFSDGARTEDDVAKVRDVRQYVKSISGFASVTVIEREVNYGLAQSIIAGVTELVDRFGAVIVLEDDLVTSKYFLRYMNEALRKYEHDERVISIHGYCYPTKQQLPETYFLRGADCWGWATWKSGWKMFEPDSRKLLHEIETRGLTRKFDYDGAYPYSRMLKNQIAGRVDSWAVRWHASAFLRNKLTLYPGRSLVNNIGGDSSATHTKSLADFQISLAQTTVDLHDIAVEENRKARDAVIEFFRSIKPSLVKRIFNKVKSLV